MEGWVQIQKNEFKKDDSKRESRRKMRWRTIIIREKKRITMR